jgi:zinc protease
LRTVRRCAVVLVVVLASCGSPRPPSRSIRFEPNVHTDVLANGLRVLVVEDRTTNLVQLAIRLDAGAASDPAGKSGLAHLAEHLMFQVGSGEGERPVGAELSAVAIAFNAVTTWESTQFVTTARGDQLARLIELEGRRFAAACANISAGTFEREREVVRNERRLHSGLVGNDLELLIRHIYPADHPYARPVSGNDAELSRLTLDDACDFIAGHYRPERMVVVLSGDVAARPAAALVKRYMGRLRGRGRAARSGPSYPRMAGVRRSARDNVLFGGEPAVVVAWPLPTVHSRERAAASIALALLQSELSSAGGPGGLVLEVGESRAPVAVAVIRLRDRNRRGGADRALAAVERAVQRVASARSARAIEPLLNRRTRELLGEFDQLSSRVNRLAEGFQVGARAHLFSEELHSLTHLQPHDVGRAARALFTRERAVVVEIEPGAAPDRREPARAAVSYAGKSHDDAWTAPVDASEATVPMRVPLPRSMLARARRLRLDNGLQVILLRTPGVPLLRAQLVFGGGSADDPPGREGQAFLAAHALDFKAIRAFDAAAYKALARFGDDLEVRVDSDRTAFAVKGLSTHLDAVLAGLASLVEDGRYSDELIEMFRRFRIERSVGGQGPTPASGKRWFEQYVRLRRTLYRSVFGASHPYARSAGLGLPGRDSRITRADLELLRSRRFGARNGVLILTGDFDPSLAREHVEHWFSDLRPGEAHTAPRPPPTATAGREVFQLATDASETTLLIEIAYPTRREPGLRAARMVVARMLRERMARVREVLGAAYRVSASHEDNAGPGMFLVSAAVDARRADEALVTMLGELSRLRAGAAPDLAEAFVRARREVLYRVLAEESGADSAGARIAELLERGESLEDEMHLAREIMALTVEDLQPVLAADLAAMNETIALLGPSASIRAARRAAGL